MAGSERRYAHSEATRLLCAGVHLDTVFRARVIDELIGHEERPAAPSLGVDVVAVLAHALRARRREALTGLGLLAIWVVFFLVEVVRAVHEGPSVGALSSFAVMLYAAVCALLWLARAASGWGMTMYAASRDEFARLRLPRRATAWGLTIVARVTELGYWGFALSQFAHDPFPTLFPLLLAFTIGVHRSQVATVMRVELSRDTFAQASVAPPVGSARQVRVAQAVTLEQHASVAVYDAYRPFVGAGRPYEPWSFAMEITPAKKPYEGLNGTLPEPAGDGSTNGQRTPVRLTNRQILDLVVPKLQALRESAARTSRDRLKDLEVEEFVYLPSGVGRYQGVYEPSSARLHLDGAVDEGGEARRHFLRVRIGAWDEQVVVSVLVRVHTQGGMLVLEVVPHVLGPIVEEYRRVDLIAAAREGETGREVLRTVLSAPATGVVAGFSMLRTLVQILRTWLARPEQAPPDAPLVSVRELGSTDRLSLFQEMDVSRYIKTVEDRIASGVREALRRSGCETGSFEQNIFNVAAGGQFIGQMSGGTAVGRISKSAVAMGSGGASYTEGNRDD
ncbi:hypothetical protein OG762_17180 [Streptomyces sp. NBC_01136]|uniref:hypothetical protein n=1 Tax=unclassified Streptomyces TaxID=2593676 RepID=UPI00324F8A6F|nr:hypothetical protein OG762_17180 [Streptomyces sp. NBC_01136]